MPPGPAATGYSYQPVLQSAATAASSVRDVAVPGGDRAANQIQLCVLHGLFLFCTLITCSSATRLIKMTFSRLTQVLEADNNSIENLEGVYHLPKLEEVLLKNNSILKSIIHIH